MTSRMISALTPVPHSTQQQASCTASSRTGCPSSTTSRSGETSSCSPGTVSSLVFTSESILTAFLGPLHPRSLIFRFPLSVPHPEHSMLANLFAASVNVGNSAAVLGGTLTWVGGGLVNTGVVNAHWGAGQLAFVGTWNGGVHHRHYVSPIPLTPPSSCRWRHHGYRRSRQCRSVHGHHARWLWAVWGGRGRAGAHWAPASTYLGCVTLLL